MILWDLIARSAWLVDISKVRNLFYILGCYKLDLQGLVGGEGRGRKVGGEGGCGRGDFLNREKSRNCYKKAWTDGNHEFHLLWIKFKKQQAYCVVATVHYDVIVCVVVLVNAQSLMSGTCYGQQSCQGSTVAVTSVEDLEMYCCRYSSPGVTRGYSYQLSGTEKCFTCPRGKVLGVILLVGSFFCLGGQFFSSYYVKKS